MSYDKQTNEFSTNDYQFSSVGGLEIVTEISDFKTLTPRIVVIQCFVVGPRRGLTQKAPRDSQEEFSPMFTPKSMIVDNGDLVMTKTRRLMPRLSTFERQTHKTD